MHVRAAAEILLKTKREAFTVTFNVARRMLSLSIICKYPRNITFVSYLVYKGHSTKVG